MRPSLSLSKEKPVPRLQAVASPHASVPRVSSGADLTWRERPKWGFRWIGSEQRGTDFKCGPQNGPVLTPPLDFLETKASLLLSKEVRQILYVSFLMDRSLTAGGGR